jgi:hypothetical protein
MLGGLVRLLLYRFLGARIMLALAVFGWLRRRFGAKRDDSSSARLSAATRTSDSVRRSDGRSGVGSG